MRNATAREMRLRGDSGKDFMEIPPETLARESVQGFAVYIKRGAKYALFAKEGERFTARHAKALEQSGIGSVYIETRQSKAYRERLEQSLPRILCDATVPAGLRARILYGASTAIVREMFDERLPQGLGEPEYARLETLARRCAAFLADERSLARIASLMDHDYSVYAHSVQVFVYLTVLLRRMGFPEDMILKAGLGALLHDAGKEGIDQGILQKPGPLTPEERRIINTHPARGAAYCMAMPLAPASLACILLHHERMDGGGYPGGLPGERIPAHVRALTLADVYDALTSDRPYAKAMTPFEALRVMRDELGGAFDLDIYKAFVGVLSGADIL